MTNLKIRAAIAARGGGTTAELERVFGKFSYTNIRGGAIQVSPSWTSRNIVQLDVDTQLPYWPINEYTGQQNNQIDIHRIVAPVLVATWAEVVRLGLHKKIRTFAGSWVPRHQLHNATKPLSTHSWGCAIDFDARWNGYGVRAMKINLEFVKVFERFGWEWGGRWTSKDGMHFQYTDPLVSRLQMPWRDEMAR